MSIKNKVKRFVPDMGVARNTGSYYSICLFLIILFHFVNNYIWVSIDALSNFGSDMIHHLCFQAKFFQKFKAIFLEGDFSLKSMIAFRSLFKDLGPWCWPKLVYFTSSIANLFFGFTDNVTIMSNMIYFSILILSVYLIGKKFWSRGVGLLAALIISFYPGIFGTSRKYTLDFPLAAIVPLTLYFLMRSERFKVIRYSLSFGILFGLSLCTKVSAIIFLIGPLLYILYKIFSDTPIRFNFLKTHRKQCINFIIAFTALMLILLFAFLGSTSFKDMFLFSWTSLTDYKDPSHQLQEVFTLRWATFYFYVIRLYISLFFLCVFFVAIWNFISLKASDAKHIITIWVIVPLIIFTCISYKVDRYYFPSFPAIAIISAVGILRFKQRTMRSSLIFLIFLLGLTQFLVVSYDINSFPEGLLSRLPLRNKINFFTHDMEWCSPANPIDNYKPTMNGLADIIKKMNFSKRPVRIGLLGKFFPTEYDKVLLYCLLLNELKVDMYFSDREPAEFFNNCYNFDFIILVNNLDKLKFKKEDTQRKEGKNIFLRPYIDQEILLECKEKASRALSFPVSEMEINEIIEDFQSYRPLKEVFVSPEHFSVAGIFYDTSFFLCQRKPIEIKDEKLIRATSFYNAKISIWSEDRRFIISEGNGPFFAEYELFFVSSGSYELQISYATEGSRPVDIYFDGGLVRKGALKELTGGWGMEYLRWSKVARININSGNHTLRLTSDVFPCIKDIKFYPNITTIDSSS